VLAAVTLQPQRSIDEFVGAQLLALSYVWLLQLLSLCENFVIGNGVAVGSGVGVGTDVGIGVCVGDTVSKFSTSNMLNFAVLTETISNKWFGTSMLSEKFRIFIPFSRTDTAPELYSIDILF
jgi:hypothetical protein